MTTPHSITVPPASFALALQEDERLAALHRLDVIDTPHEEAFARITRLVRRIMDMPVALVSLIDGHRQWNKACQGLDQAQEFERRETFCNITIKRVEPLFVTDAATDPWFSDNAYVVGQPFVRAYAGVPLRTRDGHNIGTLCALSYEPRSFTARERDILVDLADIAMGEFELRVMAGEDVLTGALSRRAFKDDSKRALAIAQRGGYAFSVIVFDLDHFKKVNDTYGHAAGDEVLKRTAAACHGLLRPSDLFGRIGGEEFALVMPHTTALGAMAVAERLRETIGNLRIEVADGTISPAASFGVATMTGDGLTLDSLLANADSALYEAKAAGRNRCVLRNSQGGTPQSTRSVMKAGLIHSERAEPVACTVRIISATGASLDVWDAAELPESCRLVLPADGLERDCRIVVRTNRHIEVEFRA
ncbi:diguanylate cyclase [Aliihoeflea aestuarii]|jgi:diguanylate cyclase (GGDEF)-like protein|uniref:sensor domain-containing diguanylate cyclase n=1 Tax=Aliihoeflea aestuarii TaxID=453840 RepID=UPI00209207A4|nr:sensor domain-containing diguanylate cyclase [Aliihoeflea aestuarii]MCO6389900.1 diguanylate cyclase [Aliihoeflea aestuarii]